MRAWLLFLPCPCIPQATNHMERSTDLTNWTAVGAILTNASTSVWHEPADNAPASLAEPAPRPDRAFYRIWLPNAQPLP